MLFFVYFVASRGVAKERREKRVREKVVKVHFLFVDDTERFQATAASFRNII